MPTKKFFSFILQMVKFILLIVFIFYSLISFASGRDIFLEESIKILKNSQNSTEYSSFNQTTELYQDLLGKIKNNLKQGNEITPVDYQLLLDGLIFDNYLNLQSVLGFNNYHDTLSDFKNIFNEIQLQKIVYSIKQNENAIKTNFSVVLNKHQQICKIVLNGKEFNHLDFTGPSNIPFYIGIYCPDKTFEVKKIQSQSAEQFLRISFNSLHKITFNKEIKEQEIQLTNSQKSSRLLNELKEDSYSKNPSTTNDSYSLSTGFGFTFPILENQTYFERGSQNNKIIPYFTNHFSFNHFTLLFDIGKIIKTKQTIMQYETNKIIERFRVHESFSSLFIRPGVGFNFGTFNSDNHFIDLDLMTIFITNVIQGQQGKIEIDSYGTNILFAPKIKLSGSYFLSPTLNFIWNFGGRTKNSLIGAQIMFGTNF